MKAILDTSVVIGGRVPTGVEAAISVATITELTFGLLLPVDPEGRARRADRLATTEAAFDPVPVSVEIARAWGRLATAVAERGGRPRHRQLDLAIAATAQVEGVLMLTEDVADFRIVGDLVDVRAPTYDV